MLPRVRVHLVHRTVVKALFWVAALSIGQVCLQPASAQTGTPVNFESSTGLKIQITPERANVSDEELAQALEQAAQRLRYSRAPTPREETPPELTQIAAQALAPPPAAEPQPDAATEGRPAWILGPTTLLWMPPLANPWEPRFTLKHTTLENATTTRNYDTAVGGTAPGIRRNLERGLF